MRATNYTGILVGVITAIVAGIGIMNILLVSVKERTREIGIRRAVGARRATILWQFLCEAVMVALVGGAVGIALASGFASIIDLLSPLPAKVAPWVMLYGANRIGRAGSRIRPLARADCGDAASPSRRSAMSEAALQARPIAAPAWSGRLRRGWTGRLDDLRLRARLPGLAQSCARTHVARIVIVSSRWWR